MLDTVIDGYEKVAELLAHEGELLAQRIFDGDRDESESIYQQKLRVGRFTHAVHPVLAVLDSLREASHSDHPRPSARSSATFAIEPTGSRRRR